MEKKYNKYLGLGKLGNMNTKIIIIVEVSAIGGKSVKPYWLCRRSQAGQ